MRIIYRISDAGYSKVKPDYINNEACLKNATQVFKDADWLVIADNVSKETDEMIQKYVRKSDILYVSIGHGAGTFNIALDTALKYDEDEIVYFIENDYLHTLDAQNILEEGFKLGASFISLYDHPDKYLDPRAGGNPYCEGGAEDTRVYLTENTHWKITNAATMTFAAKSSALKQTQHIFKKHTLGSYPQDFHIFVELRNEGELLISPIPSRSTHGETAWLAPLIDWSKV